MNHKTLIRAMMRASLMPSMLELPDATDRRELRNAMKRARRARR